ncbi:MAG TPA: hypothetical protein VFQ58_03005 [Flavisolibacter sp.]|nr:hypothetical protein [Flavisolibacter sp.]
MRSRFLCVLLIIIATSCTRTNSTLEGIKTANTDFIKKKVDSTIIPIKLKQDTLFRY